MELFKRLLQKARASELKPEAKPPEEEKLSPPSLAETTPPANSIPLEDGMREILAQREVQVARVNNFKNGVSNGENTGLIIPTLAPASRQPVQEEQARDSVLESAASEAIKLAAGEVSGTAKEFLRSKIEVLRARANSWRNRSRLQRYEADKMKLEQERITADHKLELERKRLELDRERYEFDHQKWADRRKIVEGYIAAFYAFLIGLGQRLWGVVVMVVNAIINFFGRMGRRLGTAFTVVARFLRRRYRRHKRVVRIAKARGLYRSPQLRLWQWLKAHRYAVTIIAGGVVGAGFVYLSDRRGWWPVIYGRLLALFLVLLPMWHWFAGGLVVVAVIAALRWIPATQRTAARNLVVTKLRAVPTAFRSYYPHLWPWLRSHRHAATIIAMAGASLVVGYIGQWRGWWHTLYNYLLALTAMAYQVVAELFSLLLSYRRWIIGGLLVVLTITVLRRVPRAFWVTLGIGVSKGARMCLGFLWRYPVVAAIVVVAAGLAYAGYRYGYLLVHYWRYVVAVLVVVGMVVMFRQMRKSFPSASASVRRATDFNLAWMMAVALIVIVFVGAWIGQNVITTVVVGLIPFCFKTKSVSLKAVRLIVSVGWIAAWLAIQYA